VCSEGTVLTERRTFAVPDDDTPGSVETCSKETVSVVFTFQCMKS